jgi:hypothetical protein
MDVVWGETAGVEGQLLLLCPVLFLLQVLVIPMVDDIKYLSKFIKDISIFVFIIYF